MPLYVVDLARLIYCLDGTDCWYKQAIHVYWSPANPASRVAKWSATPSRTRAIKHIDKYGGNLGAEPHPPIEEAIALMQKLRRRGVRSHFWV